MLDNDLAKKLEESILNRLNEIYPQKNGEPSLTNIIAQISAHTVVIALCEYEKLNHSGGQ